MAPIPGQPAYAKLLPARRCAVSGTRGKATHRHHARRFAGLRAISKLLRAGADLADADLGGREEPVRILLPDAVHSPESSSGIGASGARESAGGTDSAGGGPP